MKLWSSLLVCALVFCASAGSALGARGVIVFAAMRNGPSTSLHPRDFTTIDTTFHLWRVRPDGSGRRQLTWGRDVSDDTVSVSPDGRWALFDRSVLGQSRACLVGVDRGRVRTLFTPQRNTCIDGLGWSPDGRHVSVYVDCQRYQYVEIVDVSSGDRWRIPDARDWAWSPDSRRLYVGYDDGRDRIFEMSTRKSTRVESPVWGALWLDGDTIFGTKPEPHEHSVDRVRVIDGRGHLKLERDMTPSIGMMNEWPGRSDQVWHLRSRTRPSSKELELLLAYHTRISDGGANSMYLVSYPSMKVVDLPSERRWCGVSPDGQYVAAADWDWWTGRTET